MQSKYNYLIRKSNLLNTLQPEDIKQFLSCGQFKIVSYGKNSIIHFDGEICNKLDIILAGKVVVERIDEQGNLLTIADFYSDDILGGNLIFSKNPCYPMTITAKSSTIILEVPKNLLFELFSENRLFLRTFLEYISDNAFKLSDRIKHYVHKSIRECLISYLEYEQKKQDTNKIKLTMSKKKLAEKIGVQRTSLSRELKKMQDDGLIKFDSKYIIIIDGKL